MTRVIVTLAILLLVITIYCFTVWTFQGVTVHHFDQWQESK